MREACLALLCTFAVPLAARADGPARERAAVEARVRSLLDAYAANDAAAVLALVDPNGFIVYGSDVSEVVTSAEGLKQMMADDFRLWGSAHFGAPSTLDIRQGKDLATAFFHVPFTAGKRPPILLRVSSVWRKVNGTWLLTQFANTVPTTGSSARELLRQ
jgi:hypothetical protein